MYLGIDVGTSGVKVVLTNDGNNIIASETSKLNVMRPKHGWSEQDPNNWWLATNKAVDNIKNQFSNQLKQVQGIGLSGQMHGLTALDASDQPLRPSILWSDTRSFEEAKYLDETEPLFRSVGGNVVMPGFTAPKALWLKRNEADFTVPDVNVWNYITHSSYPAGEEYRECDDTCAHCVGAPNDMPWNGYGCLSFYLPGTNNPKIVNPEYHQFAFFQSQNVSYQAFTQSVITNGVKTSSLLDIDGQEIGYSMLLC